MSYNFGLPSTPTTQAALPGQNTSGQLTFGKPTTPTTKPAFSLTPNKPQQHVTPTTKTDTKKVSFNVPTSTMATTGGLTYQLPNTTTSIAGVPPKTEANKPGFALPTSVPSTTGLAPTTSVPSSIAAQTVIPTASSMTYSQVEDLLNKWTSELAEQEILFQDQVKQVNGWDKILLDNSTKLSKLHTTIDKVQQQQKKINFDLDFIIQQQKDLENALAPLEKEYSSSNYHPDIQREKMYQTAETIDAQIKKMSEDVKETIEHVNETAPSQEKSHPILLIGRVLNAHMNTLQWVDENSAQLQSQIESMSRYLDNIKRENDRSYNPFP